MGLGQNPTRARRSRGDVLSTAEDRTSELREDRGDCDRLSRCLLPYL